MTDWEAQVPVLQGILDPRWPYLPNGKELAWFAGTQIVYPVEDPENLSRQMRAYWHHLQTVKPDEIEKAIVVFRASNGSLQQIRMNVKKLYEALASERQRWIDYIDKMKTLLPKDQANEATILKMMQQNFGNEPFNSPGIAEKLDAVSRLIARFVFMAVAGKLPYDPTTRKRRGDAFDINLLFYVPLPAVIVTNDNPLVENLKMTKAPTARQLLTIEEFNGHLQDGTLAGLVSAFQT
ncbi:MAG: hypothetical protein JO348_15680, partial [Alphaproteobacteria bacterium]|nr:hypothetical protein [Alphaproteobacteria bacterium]